MRLRHPARGFTLFCLVLVSLYVILRQPLHSPNSPSDSAEATADTAEAASEAPAARDFLLDFHWRRLNGSDEQLSLRGQQLTRDPRTFELHIDQPHLQRDGRQPIEVRSTIARADAGLNRIHLSQQVSAQLRGVQPAQLHAEHMILDNQAATATFSGQPRAEGIGWRAAAERIEWRANREQLEMQHNVEIRYRRPASEPAATGSGN